MKKIILVLSIILGFVIESSSQNLVLDAPEKFEKKIEKIISLNINCDIISRWIWRGVDYGSSPTIQPYLSITTGNFEFGTYGSVTTRNTYSDLELFAKYNYKNLSLVVTDYFFQDGLPLGGPTNTMTPNTKYFNFDNHTTGHLTEATLQYKTKNLSLQANTFIYGWWDKDIYNKQKYSTYIEAAYSIYIKDNKLDIFVGGNPFDSPIYGKRNIINTGITGYKTLNITDKYTIPLRVTLVTNPTTEKIYLVLGISL